MLVLAKTTVAQASRELSCRFFCGGRGFKIKCAYNGALQCGWGSHNVVQDVQLQHQAAAPKIAYGTLMQLSCTDPPLFIPTL